MREPDTYCLPVQEEMIEGAFRDEKALEILESAAGYDYEQFSTSELSDHSSEAWRTVYESLERFNENGLVEKFERPSPKSNKYRVTDEGLALASLYSQRGLNSFEIVQTKEQKLLSELRENDGKLTTRDLEGNYSSSTIGKLEDEGRLGREEMHSISILHLPEKDITEEDRKEAIQKVI